MLWALLSLWACSGGKDSGGDPSEDTAATSGDTGDTGDTADTGSAQLPDLLATLPAGAGDCEEVNDALPTGARGWYWGEYHEQGGAWYGQEKLILHANAQWQAQGQGDCEVVWAVTATEVELSSCTSCTGAMEVSASLDAISSTCPLEIVAGQESYTVTYGLIEADDGTASWFFASGAALGSGYWVAGGRNFLSEGTCFFF